MKYIIEFEDEPYMREDGVNYYTCKSARWYKLGETIINRLTPYTEPDIKAIEDEAWEFARGLLNYTDDDWETITNMLLLDIPYQEAKSKYEAWKKQKDEIKVGDEVEYPPNKAKGIVVQCHVPDVYAEVDKYAVFTGTSVEYLPIEWLTKTGRVFPEVAELLEKMRGEEE